jgi:glycosyltransferase involved in cell wall biosynthesis
MPALSAVVITFNEEKNIARCLESLRDLADEILVVDSGSNDATREIAESLGARVIIHPFEGHIQQKNYAASQAIHDVVLSLDADEVVSEELYQSIRQVKDAFSCDGYTLNRLANYCGQWIRHCGWYPDKKLRLWNRRKGSWGGVNPHDRYIMEKGARICHLKGNLLHYTVSSTEQHWEQVQKFSSIAAAELHRQGRRAGFYHIWIRPVIRFLRDYIYRAGFLDGYYGFLISERNAAGVHLKFKMLKNLRKGKLQLP